MLVPPYSSETVMPSTPRSPNLRHRSIGNWSLRSISAARGAISFAVNCSSVSRSIATSSPRSNFSPGMVAIVGLFWFLCVADCRSVDAAFAALDRHQRGRHRRHQLLAAAARDADRVALGDDDRTAGLAHAPDETEA